MTTGTFSGTPMTEWLIEPGSDRSMRLLQDFWYIDPEGRRWEAPQGSVINGASIPETLWASVGSPYTGDYRRASIVHDVACAHASIPREQSDEMFYFACLAGGCSTLKAKLLYAGVRIGSWVHVHQSGAQLFAVEYMAGSRLPNQFTQEELEIRARFTVISLKLGQSSDSFAETRSLVELELK